LVPILHKYSKFATVAEKMQVQEAAGEAPGSDSPQA
jgi:hypothetical protein